MGFDVAPRTIIFKETNGEPVVVKVSEVDYFLANGYVEKFTEAKRINIRRIKRKLKTLQAAVKKLPDLKTCQEVPLSFKAISNRLYESIERLKAKEGI